MCVLINKPKNVEIPIETFKRCFFSNSHGAGFMWAENGKLFTLKGYMNYDTFLGAYNSINPLEKNVVIHFREASCGLINQEQTHPFLINENLAVMHNGHIISEMVERELDKNTYISDTYICVEKILKKLPKNFLENDGIIELLKEYFLGSIFVFMDYAGKVTLVKEDDIAGYEEGGCWFSNDYWKKEYIVNRATECEDYDNMRDVKPSQEEGFYGRNWIDPSDEAESHGIDMDDDMDDDMDGEFGDDEGLMDKVLNR